MKVLTLNVGSSSVKFQVIDTEKKRALLKGLVDAIGLDNSNISFSISGDKFSSFNIKTSVKNHREALKYALNIVLDSGFSKSEIKLVAHRVVHGGRFTTPCFINKRVIERIRKLSELAPLHNPNNLIGILEAKKFFPKAKHVAVFDTAFHQTMPDRAFIYGLPFEFYKKENIRRYGFHGISHKFVSEQAVKVLGRKNFKLITCHIGNGISVTAVQVKNGRPVSLDTSMGFTPLEGPIMGTRSGSLDPGILIHLLDKGYSKNKLNDLLNEESGLKGISGLSSDMRVLLENYSSNRRAKLAVDVLTYQLAKTIASYTVALNGFDVLLFTAGIGSGSWFIRSEICKKLSHFGVKLDARRNKKNSLIISSDKSKVKVLVLPTDEELEMALEAEKLFNSKS